MGTGCFRLIKWRRWLFSEFSFSFYSLPFGMRTMMMMVS